MPIHSKKYREAVKLIDRAQTYSSEEAVKLAKQSAYAKFDETVELHLRIGVDPRQADQQVRGVALLPHGLGKQVRILVFTQGEGDRIAREAGAEPATLAIAWVLAHPAITTPIIGASNPQQLKASVAAAEFKLEPALKTRLDELSHEYRMGDAPR